MVLISTTERARSIEEISRDNGIPISTCYEKVTELFDRGILKRERMLITKTGKRCALYRAAVKTFYVRLGVGGIGVIIIANEEEFGNSLLMEGPVAPKPADMRPYAEAVVHRRFHRE